MAKNAMPVSKAKTAYELLGEIRDLILEEPLRYDQGSWKVWMRRLDEAQRPACGTTACVAGWVDTLKAKRPTRAYDIWRGNAAERVRCKATRILGITARQAGHLFGVASVGHRRADNIEDHAKRGAAHIAKFQKKYAKQLKAKRV